MNFLNVDLQTFFWIEFGSHNLGWVLFHFFSLLNSSGLLNMLLNEFSGKKCLKNANPIICYRTPSNKNVKNHVDPTSIK